MIDEFFTRQADGDGTGDARRMKDHHPRKGGLSTCVKGSLERYFHDLKRRTPGWRPL